MAIIPKHEIFEHFGLDSPTFHHHLWEFPTGGGRESQDSPPKVFIPAGNPPATPIMKGIPVYSLLVKVARGVFQFGVLKQP